MEDLNMKKITRFVFGVLVLSEAYTAFKVYGACKYAEGVFDANFARKFHTDPTPVREILNEMREESK